MTKTTRKKRNKLTIALIAPILAIVFIISWSLSWIGSQKQSSNKNQSAAKAKTASMAIPKYFSSRQSTQFA